VIVHDWAEARLQPLIDTIKRIDNRLRALARHNTLTHQAALVTLRHIRFDIIPQVQNALIVFIQNRVAALIAYNQAVAAQLNARMSALSSAQQAYSLALAQQLQLQIARTRAELLADDRAVIAYAQQLTTQAMVRADQEIERAVRALQLDDQLVITYAQQLNTATAQYARQLVLQEQQQRQAQVADAERQAVAIGGAVLGLTMTAVAQLASRVKKIEESDCQQKCETLGQLGGSIEALDLAALLAFIGYSAHDEHGAEQLAEQVISPIAKVARTAFRIVTDR
jgi:hypothetical protein